MNAPTVLRAVNGFAGLIAPGLPARKARDLLLRPHRHAPRPWELPALHSGQRIHFRFGLSGLRWGQEGPVVLMMHGWEGRPTQFRYFVEPLVASGRQVIALEAPAHGESPGERTTLMAFAMAIAEAAVEIRNLETVVAHSMGATATVIALSQGLSADRVVLLSPHSAVEAGLYKFAHALGLPPRAASRFVELVGRANGVPARELEASQLVRRLRQPALIVHDRDDTTVPHAEGAAVAANWRGARLLTTTRLGHWRVLTDSGVAEAVTDFIAGREVGTPTLLN